jgi:hypothetical protein
MGMTYNYKIHSGNPDKVRDWQALESEPQTYHFIRLLFGLFLLYTDCVPFELFDSAALL